MPLGFLRDRLTAAANGTSFLLSASLYANFFVLTLYMQQVLHYSALQAGLAFLATAGHGRRSSPASAQALVTRIGVKPVLLTGLVLLVLASLWYTRLPVDGKYPDRPAPSVHRLRRGIALSFVPVTIAALAGAPEEEAGLASGLINTSQQIGGAIGARDRRRRSRQPHQRPACDRRGRGRRPDRGIPARLLGRRARRRRRAAGGDRLHPARRRSRCRRRSRPRRSPAPDRASRSPASASSSSRSSTWRRPRRSTPACSACRSSSAGRDARRSG